MITLQEQRPVVQAECTLKESAAINQILGRRWKIFFRQIWDFLNKIFKTTTTDQVACSVKRGTRSILRARKRGEGWLSNNFFCLEIFRKVIQSNYHNVDIKLWIQARHSLQHPNWSPRESYRQDHSSLILEHLLWMGYSDLNLKTLRLTLSFWLGGIPSHLVHLEIKE